MYGTGRGTAWGYSLFEFEVYGTPAGGSGTVTVTTPANQTSTVGTAASLQISASATPAGTQTYSATGLPAATGIDGTARIFMTPPSIAISWISTTPATGSMPSQVP